MADQSALERRKVFVDGNACLSDDAVVMMAKGKKFKIADLFSVNFRGEKLYPAFQFDGEGNLRNGVKTVLSLMAHRRTSWQIALWLNGEGHRPSDAKPLDRLDDIAWLTKAAETELAPWIGSAIHA